VYPVLQLVISTFVGADGGMLDVVTYRGGADNGPTPEQLMLDIWIAYKVACVKPGIVYVVAGGVPLMLVEVVETIEPVDDISDQ
jgi:hypothetical protein